LPFQFRPISWPGLEEFPPQQLRCHVISSQWEAVKNRFFIIFKFNKKSIYLPDSKGYTTEEETKEKNGKKIKENRVARLICGGKGHGMGTLWLLPLP